MRKRIVSSMLGMFPGAMLALVIGMLVFSPGIATAATNTSTGDIAGVDADLDDSSTINLTTQTLGLVKKAFLADGTALSDGASVPKGTVVKFLIYINNNTPVTVNDVSVRDVLNASFGYQAGTLKVNNGTDDCALAACTGGEEATIFSDVDGTAALTDAVDADAVSITGATVDAGNANVANAQVNAAANKVWALLISVKMQ